MLRNRQFGQGMTEYIIIVALIAIAAIGAYGYFGKVLRADVAGMSQEMAGKSSQESVKKAEGAATDAFNEVKDKGLDNYGSAK